MATDMKAIQSQINAIALQIAKLQLEQVPLQGALRAAQIQTQIEQMSANIAANTPSSASGSAT